MLSYAGPRVLYDEMCLSLRFVALVEAAEHPLTTLCREDASQSLSAT
jgi:hypothetical protein